MVVTIESRRNAIPSIVVDHPLAKAIAATAPVLPAQYWIDMSLAQVASGMTTLLLATATIVTEVTAEPIVVTEATEVIEMIGAVYNRPPLISIAMYPAKTLSHLSHLST